MAGNSSLKNAKLNKNDEFYTQLEDIEAEMQHYTQYFNDKVVYCNCDNPEWSNFWNYFHLNFAQLGLKSLIATFYSPKNPVYKKEYTGGNDYDVGLGIVTPLQGNGDFRSDECIDILKQADIVVTNPPFSLFREYMALLVQQGKEFVIIGNKNAISYKEIFPLIRDNKVKLGYTKPSGFITADSFDDVDLRGLTRWFTNVNITKHVELLNMTKCYNTSEYPQYDNYDAINVDKVKLIPSDYTGNIGVPISFIDKYNPDQFEIVDILNPVLKNKREKKALYKRLIIKRK